MLKRMPDPEDSKAQPQQAYATGISLKDLEPQGVIPFESPWGTFAIYSTLKGPRAAEAFCPHMLGPLWEGTVSPEGITCPWHRWTFDLESGRCTRSPRSEGNAHSIRTLPLTIGADGSIVAGPPASDRDRSNSPTFSHGRGAEPRDATLICAAEVPPMKTNHNILEAVGKTPLVRLQRLGVETGCHFLAKCEFLNPGGSVKDRIGKRMVEEAEKSGRIKPGDTLIEATSGNTGIGMAMAAAVKGYRMVITMPEKMSHEKQVVLEALGAEIIRTPNEAAWDSPESHIGVAIELQRIIPNAHILDQYKNNDNPQVHFDETAGEILEQTEGGQFDYFVATAGTGGTLSGVARRLKQDAPNVEIVGVDPVGSILAGPSEITPYKVEGIGYDFIPDVLDRELVDRWIKTDDRESFFTARQLIRREGLLCGGSSGSAMAAAIRLAKEVGPGKRILTILPDSVRNYMTKFMDPAWMRENGFFEERWEDDTVGDILRRMPGRDLITAAGPETVADTVLRMKEAGVSQLPVLDEGQLVGIVTESDLLGAIVEGRAQMTTAIAEVMFRRVETIHQNAPARSLLDVLEGGSVGLVVDDRGNLAGILTKMDLVDHLANSVPA